MLHEPTAKPYLIRAVYEWCADQMTTPYIAVYVDSLVSVPMAFVKDSQIVLNISPTATSQLSIDNEFIQFTARFSGRPHRVVVPISHILAVYARENQQGFQFPVNPDDFDEILAKKSETASAAEAPDENNQKKSEQTLTKPHLHRVK